MQSDGSTFWLVAEDSDDDFFLLERACSKLNPAPKLQRAGNGVEAQQYLAGDGPFTDRAAHPLPSMVVSDLKMPLMDGLELLAWFRDQPWRPAIPFVLLTSSNDQSDRNRARERGTDEFLVKPGRFGELVSTVAGISERH
jgi:CheY-like chemotaxis protein